jgi:hypothetical protein
MFKIGENGSNGSRSMYAKEDIPLLRKVLSTERWFQILLISELDKHKLGKTARILAEYRAPGIFPENLVSTTFTLAQEWADQLGEKVLVEAETCMGAPPMGLFYQSRRKHFNRRDPMPLNLEVAHGEWHDIPAPMGFLPINCPFCAQFVNAVQYQVVLKDGMQFITPSCMAHRAFVEDQM